MAASCEPETVPSNWRDNIEEQENEIQALESIFEDTGRLKFLSAPPKCEENNCKEVPKDALYCVEISIPVHLDSDVILVESWVPFEYDVQTAQQAASQIPTAQKPQFERTVSGRRWHSSFPLSHLTPLCLQVSLPLSYPSDMPPVFTLSCLWLDASQLSALCSQLDGLWGENLGMAVLYTWVDWLQDNTLKFLCIENTVTLIPYMGDDDGMCEARDPRALPECSDLQQDLLALLRWDHEEDCKQFLQNSHVCGICLEEKTGREFFRINECRHHYCHECMMSYCEMHVTDGTINQLQCPDGSCEASLPPGILRAVLSEEAYQRWERLLLQKALATMGDIEWCPRCNNPVIRESQDKDKSNLAYCTHCSFAFCTECQEGWHQGRKCQSVADALAALEAETGEASSTENPKMSQTEKMKKLQRLRMEFLSKNTIKDIAKRCPNSGCGIPIQKSEGCNKVVCTSCHSIMCWKCGKQIKGYDHFSGNKCILFGDQEDNYIYGQHLRNRPVPEGGQMVAQELELDPAGALQRIVLCPRCRQRNIKQDRNNHVKCWSCRCNVCFCCKQAITGVITEHFTGPACSQHS